MRTGTTEHEDTHIPWYSWESKNPNAPTLLALHGFTGSALDFSPLLQTPPTHHWLACDLPGHGKRAHATDPKHFTLQHCIDSIQTLQRSHQLNKPFILGYSMGARIALHYALAHPDEISGLVLISGSPGIQDPAEAEQRRRTDHTLATTIREKGIPHFLETWQQHPTLRSQQNIATSIKTEMQIRRLKNTTEGLALSLEHLGTGELPSLWEKLKTFTRPTLLITGEEDLKFCKIAQQVQQLCPQATHQIIPQAGHTCHCEKPEATAQVIHAFTMNLSKT